MLCLVDCACKPCFGAQKAPFFLGKLDGKEAPTFSNYELQVAKVEAARALGKQQLYDAQDQAVDALFSGNDVMLHVPTAAGKTLVGFAFLLVLDVLLNGITPRLARPLCFLPCAVYISPLISLMDQQAHEFNTSCPALYPAVNCSSEALTTRALEQIRDGLVSVLFMSPENALSKFLWIFSSAIYAGRIVLLYIDEAHCVSAWSHDFRTEYGNLKRLRSIVGYDTMCLAASATLTFVVKHELGDLLGLQDPVLVERPNHRPEIYLENIEYEQDDWRWIFTDLIAELKEKVC